LFSKEEIRGNPKTNRLKYSNDATCPISTNGSSTGWLPIHVKTKKVATRTQKVAWDSGRNELDSFLDVLRRGIKNKTNIAATSAITPPSLLGMDRKIA